MKRSVSSVISLGREAQISSGGRSVFKLALFVFLLFMLRGTVTSAASPKTFELDSTESTYPFVMRLEGTMELRNESLVIEVRRGVVRSAIPMDIGEQGVARDVRITFGLGQKTPQGWTTSHETPEQSVAMRLAPGEAMSLGPMRFVISGLAGVVLRERWLAASLGVMQRLPGLRPGVLWSHACAEDNMLGPTDASRERARLMRTAYSRTC